MSSVLLQNCNWEISLNSHSMEYTIASVTVQFEYGIALHALAWCCLSLLLLLLTEKYITNSGFERLHSDFLQFRSVFCAYFTSKFTTSTSERPARPGMFLARALANWSRDSEVWLLPSQFTRSLGIFVKISDCWVSRLESSGSQLVTFVIWKIIVRRKNEKRNTWAFHSMLDKISSVCLTTIVSNKSLDRPRREEMNVQKSSSLSCLPIQYNNNDDWSRRRRKEQSQNKRIEERYINFPLGEGIRAA